MSNKSMRQFLGTVAVIGAMALGAEPAIAACPPGRLDIEATFNIRLADFEQQKTQTLKWLANPHSGYPALMDRICSVLDGKKLKNAPPSLLVINHENLLAHGIKDDKPIVNAGDIDDGKLRKAIVDAWTERNSSALTSGKPVTFDSITIPR